MPPIETTLPVLILVAALAYGLGSVPFGLVMAKVFGLPDPRTIGSKNIGATNVLRTGSKGAALATVLLDGAKGLVAVLVARAFVGEDAAQLAGLSAFLGHIYSVFLGFKGGKGVATLLGSVIGLAPVIGVIAMASWLVAFLVFRISSLSALIAAVLTPLAASVLGYGSMVAVLILMSAILIWKHGANIQRLLNGTEPVVDWRKR